MGGWLVDLTASNGSTACFPETDLGQSWIPVYQLSFGAHKGTGVY